SAPASLLHVWNHFFREMNHAQEVSFHSALPFVGGGIEELLRRRATRIRDTDIDTAETRRCLSNEPLYGSRVGNVDCACKHFRTLFLEFFRSRADTLFVSRTDGQFGTLGSERGSYRKTESLAGSGNNRHPITNSEIHGYPFRQVSQARRRC